MNSDSLNEGMNSFRELMPRMWWNIYQGCLQSGFTPDCSMVLTQTYILSQGKITPPSPQGELPKSDKPDE